MNHIFRLVWNGIAGSWVAVAECARGVGRHGGRCTSAPSASTPVEREMPIPERHRTLITVGCTTVLGLGAVSVQAQLTPSAVVAPDTGRAQSHMAPNGVTIVDINSPNAAGLSHNKYLQYDVRSEGLVLNNHPAGQDAASSHLAGHMAANPNLAVPASVILNEVIGPHRSSMLGLTEVTGSKADVVVANPYGITCSGCGFIHTDRVTLTTGIPGLTQEGVLAGFNVDRGDILITGTGLDASAQKVLDLVTRSVFIDGPLRAQDLGVNAGLNAWNYTTRTIQGNTKSDISSQAHYAIDSSALGGMYAQRIQLTSTEAGVGVRMLGNAAANTGDFVLLSNGRIELAQKISASEEMEIQELIPPETAGTPGTSLPLVSVGLPPSVTESTPERGIQLGAQATLSAQHNLHITGSQLDLEGNSADTARIIAAQAGKPGTTGTIKLQERLDNDGLIYSGRDLLIDATALNNGGTAAIYAAGKLNVTIEPDAAQPTSPPTVPPGSLINQPQALLFASEDLSINTPNIILNQGDIRSGKSISARASTMTNEAVIDSAGSLDIQVTNFSNSVPGGDSRQWTDQQNLSEAVKDGNLYSDGGAGGARDTAQNYVTSWTMNQFYAAGKPKSAPQLTSAGPMQLSFVRGENLGGIIHSPVSIELAGASIPADSEASMAESAGPPSSPSVPRFINDNLTLEHRNYTEHYTLHTKYAALGPIKRYKDQLCTGAHWDPMCTYDGDVISHTASFSSPLKASILTEDLRIHGLNLVNQGNPAASPQLAGALQSHGLSDPAHDAPTNAMQLALPTNPNGFMALVPGPAGRHLIEQNPLYASLASTPLASPESAQAGSATTQETSPTGEFAHSADLIRQQILLQTGRTSLPGHTDVDSEIADLMASGAQAATNLKLDEGMPLTHQQQNALSQDIIWPVHTMAENGVLLRVPRVYLAPATRLQAPTGSFISGTTTDLDLTLLTNQGGTIAGSQQLDVVAQGDINNLSGSITGGDVHIRVPQGSMRSQTVALGSGPEQSHATTLGDTARLLARGTVDIAAAVDIANVGASISAEKDVRLHAGRDIDLDTVENRTGQMLGGAAAAARGSAYVRTQTSRIEQVASTLSAGGHFSAHAAGDLKMASATVNVGQNAQLRTDQGDIDITGHADTTPVRTDNGLSGFWVDHALYSSSRTRIVDDHARFVPGTLQTRGDLDIVAGGDVTIQGAHVVTGGHRNISTNNFNMPSAVNTHSHHETTTVHSILKVHAEGTSSGTGHIVNATNADDASTTTNTTASLTQPTGAGQMAISGNAGLAFFSASTDSADSASATAITTQLTQGNNTTINARQDATFQGATISSGGHLAVNARNIHIQAARNVSSTGTRHEETALGFLARTANTASANGTLTAPDATSNTTFALAADGTAISTDFLDVFEHETSEQARLHTAHQPSALQADGHLKLNATEQLAIEGSALATGQNLTLHGRNVLTAALNDVDESRNATHHLDIGLRLNATIAASAGLGTTEGAFVQAGATGTLDVYAQPTAQTGTHGSSTAMPAELSAQGDIVRSAVDTLADAGTHITAEGNINQTAADIQTSATRDTVYEQTTQYKSGVSVGGNGRAQARLGVKLNPASHLPSPVTAKLGPEVEIGAMYESASHAQDAQTAHGATLHAGQSVSTNSTRATQLEGTHINAGKDIQLSAGSLDVQQAQSRSETADGRLNTVLGVGIDPINKTGHVDSSLDHNRSAAKNMTSTPGDMHAGQDLTLSVKGNATFAGTHLTAERDVAVDSQGNLELRSTTNQSSKEVHGGSIAITVAPDQIDTNHPVSFKSDRLTAHADQGQAPRITSTQGNIALSASGQIAATGLEVKSAGTLSVTAGGNVAFAPIHHETVSNETQWHFAAPATNSTTGTVNAPLGTTDTPTGLAKLLAPFRQVSNAHQASTVDSRFSSGNTTSISSGGNVDLGNATFIGPKDPVIHAAGKVINAEVVAHPASAANGTEGNTQQTP